MSDVARILLSVLSHLNVYIYTRIYIYIHIYIYVHLYLHNCSTHLRTGEYLFHHYDFTSPNLWGLPTFQQETYPDSAIKTTFCREDPSSLSRVFNMNASQAPPLLEQLFQYKGDILQQQVILVCVAVSAVAFAANWPAYETTRFRMKLLWKQKRFRGQQTILKKKPLNNYIYMYIHIHPLLDLKDWWSQSLINF